MSSWKEYKDRANRFYKNVEDLMFYASADPGRRREWKHPGLTQIGTEKDALDRAFDALWLATEEYKVAMQGLEDYISRLGKRHGETSMQANRILLRLVGLKSDSPEPEYQELVAECGLYGGLHWELIKSLSSVSERWQRGLLSGIFDVAD